MKKIIPFSLTVCLSHFAIAADDSTNIIISTSRGAAIAEEQVASVTVIDQVDILRSGASNLAEVLRNRAGIQLTESFGDGNGTADMRGFGGSAGSNTLILVDGRRLNNSDISSPNLTSISFSNIERIEIIKGSAGSLYGDQAVGGVINIITRKVDDFAAEIKLEGGSFEQKRLVASINNRLTNQLTYRLHGEVLRADNYRDNNEQEAEHLFSRADYSIENTNIFVEYQLDQEFRQQPGSLLKDEVSENPRQSIDDFIGDYNDTKEDVWRLGVEHKMSNNFSFLTEYSERGQETEFLSNFRGCIGGNFCSLEPSNEDRTTKAFSPRAIIGLPSSTGKWLFTTGVDLEETDYEITFNMRSNEQKVNGLYFYGTVPLKQGVEITLGSRYAEVENKINDNFSFPSGNKIKDDSTVFNFGISKKIDNLRLFLRYDESFRFAKVDELAFAEDNLPLKNQEGESKEFGVELNGRFASAKALMYQLDLENEIAFDPTAIGPPGSFFLGANVNFDSTRREGINLEVESKLHSSLTLTLGYSKLKSEFKSGVFEGSSVSGVPETLGRIAFQHTLLDNWFWQVEMNYVGQQYLNGDNANRLEKKKSYSVGNVSSRFELGGWGFNMRINNLLDKKYSQVQNAFGSVNPSPERNYQLSASYQF